MGQPKEKTTVEQVLKLVEQLTVEEREQVQQALNIRAIRERLTQAEESIAGGEGIAGEVVLAELKARAEARLRKRQT